MGPQRALNQNLSFSFTLSECGNFSKPPAHYLHIHNAKYSSARTNIPAKEGLSLSFHLSFTPTHKHTHSHTLQTARSSIPFRCGHDSKYCRSQLLPPPPVLPSSTFNMVAYHLRGLTWCRAKAENIDGHNSECAWVIWDLKGRPCWHSSVFAISGVQFLNPSFGLRFFMFTTREKIRSSLFVLLLCCIARHKREVGYVA